MSFRYYEGMRLKIETVPIEKLTFDSQNARKHSDKNLSAIAQSLKDFGQRKPVVVTEGNVIVAGNGTVEAAHSLGITLIDVVRIPNSWSAEQVKAFALADNRTAELAEWNQEVLSRQLLELEQSDLSLELLGFEPTSVTDFLPVEGNVNPPLDERPKHECPHCQGLFEMVSGKPKASE